MRIALSPSAQPANIYAGGHGNEQQHCRDIAALTKPELESHGHEVIVLLGRNASDNVRLSNASKPDIHVSIHTDAGGGEGTTGFLFEGSSGSKRLTEAVYKRVAPVSPGKDRGIRRGNHLIELNSTVAVATLIELEFHDRPAGAAHIAANHALYAKALAEGILDYAGRKPASAPKPSPAPAKPVTRGIYLMHLPKRNAMLLATQAVEAGHPAWVTSAGRDHSERATNHTVALRQIIEGKSVAEVFPGKGTHAVLAVWVDFTWAATHLGSAAETHNWARARETTGNKTNGYAHHTNALADLLEQGVDIVAVFGRA